MDIKYRRIYYAVAIFVFLIVAPIILYYSLGYRYDWQLRAIYKIGAISLESNPENSDIYLNGQYQGKTNSLIQNLKPGQYSVEVKKEGYLAWQKNIEVYPTKTTIFRDIVLFKNHESAETIFSLMKNYSLNKNKEMIAYQTADNQLWLSDLDKNNNRRLNYSAGLVQTYWWSNFSDYLLIKTQTGIFYLVELGSLDKITNLSEKVESPLDNIRWDDRSDEKLFFTNQNKIFEYHTAEHTLKSIIDSDSPILDIKPYDHNLYLLNTDNRGVSLSVYALNKQEKQEIFSSQDYTALTFLNENIIDNTIFLYDQTNGNILLTSADDGEIIGQFKGINKIFPTAKEDRYLFFNEHELWIWDKKSKESSLLTRYVADVADAILLDDYFYAIFSTENKIKVIEFDARNRLTQDIFEATALHLFTLNQKDLYFIVRSDINADLFDLVHLNIR